MENTTVALTLSLIAGLSTIIGSIFIFFKKDKSILLNSFDFAAGVMITVSLIDLIPESFSYLSTYYYPFPALLFVLIFTPRFSAVILKISRTVAACSPAG